MKVQDDKAQKQQSTAAPRVQQEPSTDGTATIIDNRPVTIYQRKLRETMNAHAVSKALPVQRKSPEGSSRFQKIAMAMGETHGVDTSGLVATHNSSFPGKLNAEATIQGNKIHFAPGMDTNYNIRHEVAHAIDNTLNGTPKGDRVVNGQKVDTTREKVVDRMAKAPLHSFQSQSLPVQRKLWEAMHNSPGVQEHAALRTTMNALPVQRVRIREFHEDKATLMSLFKYKDDAEKTFYNCDKNGKVKLAGDNSPEISELRDRHNAIKIIQNPMGLPPAAYLLFRYDKIEGGNIVNKYGLVDESNITFLAEYKDIAEIGADADNPKQGKILPENKNDPPISQSDVHQTTISDCYLHAALISVVKANPQGIINLFDPEPDDSRVTVKFPEVYTYDGDHSQGYDEKKDTVIMSRRLFLKEDGSPLYGGKKGGYLWPAFVQKAWVVLKKSYANIVMGKPMEIVKKITGRTNLEFDRLPNARAGVGTTQEVSVEKAWEIYSNIRKSLKAKKAVNLTTRYWKDNGKEKSKLSYIHSYSIIGMKKHFFSIPGKLYMPNATLTLRNPREKEGNTFKISFRELMDPMKVDNITYV